MNRVFSSIPALLLLALLSADLAYAQGSELPITITQAAKPSKAPAWEQPASLALTVTDGADTFAAHVNATYEGPQRRGFGTFARIAWDRNNQLTSPQNNLALRAGFTFERGFAGEPTPPIPIPGTDDTVTSLPGLILTSKFEVGFNRQIRFNDILENPLLPETERVESIRATWDVSPWLDDFEGNSGGVLYAFAVGTGLYYDNITNNVLNLETGISEQGDVFGGIAQAALRLSTPNVRAFQLSVSGQIRQEFTSSGAREAGTEGLLKVSAEWFLINAPSLVRSSSARKEIRPSIALEYTVGEDTLNGLEDQDTLMLALRLGFF